MRTAAFLLLTLLAACQDSTAPPRPVPGPERLSARPGAATTNIAAGVHQLGVASAKDAVLHVPALDPNASVPLIVMLHGANGDQPPIDQVVTVAAQHGIPVLVPYSRLNTWDGVHGPIGPDVAIIDKALRATFERVRVQPGRIAMAGFSDGAGYALMLGIANGDLISHVISFAPGFINPVNRFGKPDIMILHGLSDPITSARATEENIVPFLRTLGYVVEFRTFDGGHQVREAETQMAVQWFMGAP